MTARNAKAALSKRQFGDLFGISEAQLERFFQQGMPHERKSKRRTEIPMPEGREWYKDYLVKKGERKAAPTTINEARLRKEDAQAGLEELKLAREQARTMFVDEHEKLLGDAFTRVRAKLVGLAPRAAAAAFGGASIPECQAKIDPLITEIMEELVAAEDVPDVGVDDVDEDAE